MKAEREAIARQFRSEGTEQASVLRAEADRQKAEILAQASEEAAKLRGDADAEFIKIYAEAFQKAPEFYRFIRTLQSYEKFVDKNTTLILPSDSELLKYLNPANVTSGAAQPTPQPEQKKP